MTARVTKSAIRKLRRMVGALGNGFVADDYYKIGRLAAIFIPDWMESTVPEHQDFEGYLYNHGLPYNRAVRVAAMALTYYEVPSLAVWQELGYHQTARCASYSQEDCRDVLMRNGVGLLDIMTLL